MNKNFGYIEGFNYFAPSSLEDALAELKNGGVIYAGGTDVINLIRNSVISPDSVVDIKNIDGLNYIEEGDNGGLKIGACTRVVDLLESEEIRGISCLDAAVNVFATPSIRSRATVGGNLCRSSPSADLAPPLIALDSKVKLAGLDRKSNKIEERTIILEDFFTGPGENVLEEEIMKEIIIPPRDKDLQSEFRKVGRSGKDLALVNVAVALNISDKRCRKARISLGSVAPTPIRAKRAEKELEGSSITEDLVKKAAEKVRGDLSCIDDIRCTGWYREKASANLVKGILNRFVVG